jgi:hypothetical protein
VGGSLAGAATRALLNLLQIGVALRFEHIAQGLISGLKLMIHLGGDLITMLFFEAQRCLFGTFDRFAFWSYLFQSGHMLGYTIKLMSQMGTISQNFSYVTPEAVP